ncbi:hypothetical protein VMCG_01249 [Cytospora schulzeri]|uniref:YDG domain-containing protein n=1 Tax=Cytospora schulzeri TaxID=448051 RepID=A0A423X6I2_9PEZI|nr:hypothetical protein VMCG_01249 [Valsa malicola]
MSTSILTPALQWATLGTEMAKQTTIPKVPATFNARSEWLIRQGKAISHCAVSSKKANQDGPPFPNGDMEKYRVQLKTTIQVLNFLESDQFEMSARYKDRTKIDQTLKVMFDMPKYRFPDEFKQRAEALYRKWESANWGETEDVGGVATTAPVPAPAPATAASSNQEDRVYQPPEGHYIWGADGIMNGVTISKKNGKKSWVVNSKARFNARGELSPGTWYPYQIVAKAHGTHGHNQCGISGNMRRGATSIVLSGAYREVDDDRGDIIYYSNPGSRDNKDPENLSKSIGRRYLDRSLLSGRPVRVLRAAKCSAYAPAVGIRYDGLYVVKARESPFRHNAEGGAYTRYVLERVPGQESLKDICERSPTAREMRHYKKIRESWNPQ